ncbi:response regulator [Paenibacillus gallinarum]|uniref:Response regulator n=1 Tax=Paenibacillus gallinarum TaxID=2762232 RepID=A0ABR8SY88_9BACL|nr:response regulator [Paenibacillus gallinarum]MBD7968484.1 response regulator [Paenibacillus gallinarum]
MCKLLIVEDEWIIRTGLRHYFPWQELGVNDIYEAENGADGLQLALEVRPDLIISDIRMPEMNGLEMIEQLRPLLPDTFYIILTGYNDFDYAKQVIRLGNIQDYLLKPLEYEESMKSVQNTLQLIRTKKEEQKERLILVEEQNKWNQSVLVKQLLDSNFTKKAPDNLLYLSDQVKSDLIYIPIVSTHIAPYGSLSVPDIKWSGEMLQLIANHIPIVPICLEDHSSPLLSYFHQNRLYVIVCCHQENLNDHNLAVAMKKLNQGQVHKTYISIGHPSPSLFELGKHLYYAEELLLLRYSERETYFFSPTASSSLQKTETSTFRLDGMEKVQLMTTLEQKDTTALHELILSFSHRTYQLNLRESSRQWLIFLQELISLILRYADHHHSSSSEIYSEQLIKLSFIEDFQTSEQLFTWLADWAEQIISNPDQMDSSSLSDSKDTYIFSEIEKFMKQHLDHDLSLQMVAERFFYNPSYLSRLFKTKLNKNYMTYVTELRIGYAKECLKDPSLLISDVSLMCGYKSYKHFVKTFRSITHMTPTHYRKRIGM